MAYVNVAEWSPEHVAEWLRGLEYSLVPYVQFFLNNKIGGSHLLNLTADDLEDLHIFKLGHQLLILEAVELLKLLHYSLNSETLQSLAVKLGCKARSLYNDLKLNGPQDHFENMPQERISTSILSAVSEVLTSVKILISWLDRLPFQHDPQCLKLKKSVLKLSIELASTTQRDQFAERPHSLIKRNSLHVAELCDKFVQDSKDSLILQPASLDIAMIKKKPDEELGIHIKSTYSGVHIIGGIKDQSPAKSCNKVEKGDEIVQVNYQTVIGWQQKKLVTAMTEHSTELHLTLKKRPRHINILGEVIILRPYRIPSKKTAKKCRNWSEDKICSPDTCSTSNESECMRDEINEDEDDSAFLPEGANIMLTNDVSLQHRLYPTPASATVQRRATVSGASPTILKPPVNIEDLVNGVTCLKSLESYGRSISHDPSNQKLLPESDISLSNNLNSFHNMSEMDNKDAINNETFELIEDGRLKSFELDALTKPLDISENGNHSGDKSPIPKLETMPVQEEECTVLENKSLCTDQNYAARYPLCVTEDSTQNKTSSVKPNATIHNTDYALHLNDSDTKHNIVLYNWEGVDTEFFGRRPSAHDISNEVAGSKVHEINPVFLRRASKLESSPINSATVKEDVLLKNADEASSYQVFVVAGVPQKCTPTTKDGKERNKGLEFMSNPSRVKGSIREKFGSRRISCKDLGKGDCEGWLYKLKEKKGFFPSSHHWVKRWTVLKDHLLYSYRDENDTKAESLISLPGSTVSPTLEYKTKRFVFKVCQLHVTFYFATESQKDLSHWMNKMGLAAIAYDASADITTSGFSKPGIVLGVANNFYSETEDSENGSPNLLRHTLSNEISPGSSSSEFSSEHNFSSRRKVKTSSISNNNTSSLAANPTIKSQCSNTKELGANGTLKYEETVDAKLPENKLDGSILNYQRDSYRNSGMRYCDYKNSRISYNRSFSTTDSSYSHPINSRSSLKKAVTENPISRQQLQEPNYQIDNSSTTGCHSNPWSSVDEEYDMLTSSLGRQQRPIAKEITPGLVARMAVSYSNLSKKNSTMMASVSKKSISNKGVPASGYVAKISDSFDHLAKFGKSSITKAHKEKKSQVTMNERDKVHCNQNYKCKRSASESQMSKQTFDYKHDKVDYSTSLSLDPKFSTSNFESGETQPEKYVSLLDKEYNKVFEGKKVSQEYLKSPTSINNFSRQGSGRRMMRFFPNANLIESSRSLVDMQNKNLVEDRSELRKTSGSDVFRDSESTFTTESSYSLSGDVYSCHKKSPSNSGSHLSDVFTSSEGIENIGFSCTDQIPIECMNTSKTNEHKQNITYPNSQQINYQNKNIPPETEIGSPRASFKFFNSPKFMKKLTSPKLDKKNIFKSKKQAKELKKTEQKEVSSQNDRTFFGSPILGRALFRPPKTDKRVITVSSGVQTDIPAGMPEFNKSFHDLNRNESSVLVDRSCNFSHSAESREEENITSKSSSCSSLNSLASNSVAPLANSGHYETKAKPQIVVTLPHALEKQQLENRMSPSDISRTPLKPMMGISMLSKKRLPSISGESSVSVSSRSSQDGSTQQHTEVSMDMNGEEYLQVKETLHSINISTTDPVHISETTESCEESS
ncbi:hypothetical protein JTE90_021492 [Oedothorax gibbosus]|uniref:Connector enhancer of kinase suppressor of ras 2 n=1 Tax=Oedothorax gibbosus TaxID=931172 RepID=A0AAV6VP25_9ARAC|nr:hypothetical protein JTE90_021492 [Oedothorax gibbosus]